MAFDLKMMKTLSLKFYWLHIIPKTIKNSLYQYLIKHLQVGS